MVARLGLRPGDEHPTRKGWYLWTDLGKRGEPLWFRPPSPVWKWVHRICIGVWLALMALGVGFALFIEQSPPPGSG